MPVGNLLKSRLFRKYTGIFVVLVSSALLLSGVVEFFVGYHDQRNALVELERERAAAAALTIEQFIDGIVRQIEGAAKNPQPASAAGLELRRRYYLGLLRHVPAVTDISYLDGTGQEQLRLSRISVDVVKGQSGSSRQPPSSGAESEVVYFSPVYFRNESEPYMTIAVREQGPDAGVVVSEVNLKFIWEVISQIKVGKTGYVYVVDARGILVAHPDISLVLKKTDLSSLAQVQMALETSPALAKLQQAEVRVAREVVNPRDDMKERRVLTTHQPIALLGWRVIVEQPLEEAFAPLYSSIWRTGLFLLAGLGLAVVASLFLARRMVTPIQALQAGAARIGAGELDQRIDVDTGDELETLADEFNRMASRLRESYASLEQKVEQRTQELVSTNEDLKKEIAERERAEAELLETRDIALEASRTKSDFLANMSHEIRTPLNAIIGMAELLSETQLNPEQLEYVRVFGTAGDRLLNTINDILDLSKLEAGQVILEGVEFDLRELVENTVEVLGVGAHEKGLKLNCHFAPDVPTALVGDPGRLGPVITNLLGNAIKFTEKGEVAVHVENDPEANSPGALRFRVCDTGIGIPPDKLDVVFESFVQADSSTTREYGGSGLGLTISRRLIELMGGRIWVESTLGKGSIFHFTARFEMPDQSNTRGLNRGSAQELPSVASSATSEARALRILLVEDSKDNRMLIQAYLRATPHQITVAENGEIAVRKFVAGNYDLVLMDMQMPVMDGYAATKAIRKWESKQGVNPTAIIALTAYALKEEVQKSLDAGCTAHISKPIKKAQLFEGIYEQINGVTA
jgi:signal transduction histidine kinase/ActR/RegA family two-component response regulator